MPHHFAQQRTREARESVPWTIGREAWVYNFLGSDPDTTITANQVEPGDMALNENEQSWIYTGLQWVQIDSSAHVSVTLDVNAATLLTLSGQELGFGTQSANLVFAGPTNGADAVPTFRSLVADDITPNFADNLFTVFDEVDPTKILVLQVSGVTTGNTRTLTVPDASGVIALTSQTDGTIRHDSDIAGISANDHHAQDHASRHQNGGADEVATATPGANAIPKAEAGGKLAVGWIQEVLAYVDLTDDPVGDHAAATDPHTVYQRESEKGAANGYAPLDASSEVADAYIPASIARDSELHAQVHGAADHTGHANWKALYTDGAGDEQELALGAADTVLRSAGVAAAPTMSAMKVSKSIIFASPNATLAVEDWLPDQAVRVPAASKHGTWTPGTIYVRVGTAGTGTNTILFRTSTTLTGVRTTRATVNLGTAREASAAITWTPADGEYMWVECSAVGGTPPKHGIAQVDIEEAIYS